MQSSFFVHFYLTFKISVGLLMWVLYVARPLRISLLSRMNTVIMNLFCDMYCILRSTNDGPISWLLGFSHCSVSKVTSACRYKGKAWVNSVGIRPECLSEGICVMLWKGTLPAWFGSTCPLWSPLSYDETCLSWWEGSTLHDNAPVHREGRVTPWFDECENEVTRPLRPSSHQISTQFKNLRDVLDWHVSPLNDA